jgi:hypothetical protein
MDTSVALIIAKALSASPNTGGESPSSSHGFTFFTERTYVEINVGSQGTACWEIILLPLEKLQIPSATSRSSFSLLRF